MQATPTTSALTTGRTGRFSLFRDFRNQMSWGRVCAAVALVVAVVGQINGMDAEHLKLWLGVAVGNYGASKITEMVCGRVDVGVAAPPARASASDTGAQIEEQP